LSCTAAGDTVRWIIGDTESGAGATRKVHILVKPTRPDLVTNLIINTDRRTYLLELRSTEQTYMASVSWQYPEDQLIALRRQNAAAATAAPIDAGIDVARLRFRYQITRDTPPWRPLSAFDDGSKVYIEMPRGLAQGEAPPLFVIGPEGDGQLVNYRVRQNYYVVDRLFGAAELRLSRHNGPAIPARRCVCGLRGRGSLGCRARCWPAARRSPRHHIGFDADAGVAVMRKAPRKAKNLFAAGLQMLGQGIGNRHDSSVRVGVNPPEKGWNQAQTLPIAETVVSA
jgi:P-type conjugative transfer protein TrbG